MDELIRLRQELHRHPELSGKENTTSKRIRFYLNKYRPDDLITGVGGEGMIAVYRGKKPGPTLLFRCELDALPIQEENELPYSSRVSGVSHSCGHDGHIAMVSGLAALIRSRPLEEGQVILLYQPDEETGTGAARMVQELAKNGLTPNFAFAIHNIPGIPIGSLVLKENTFCSASKGLRIHLTGRTTHAATPEEGVSPSIALAQMVLVLDSIPKKEKFADRTLTTIIRIMAGDDAFGTTASSGELLVTMRANSMVDLDLLSQLSADAARSIANRHGLVIALSSSDEYPPVENDSALCGIVGAVAQKLDRKVVRADKPYPWSEDFAHFTALGPAVLFGLGVGESVPSLHSPRYDFPDAAIPYGIEMLDGIISHYLR